MLNDGKGKFKSDILNKSTGYYKKEKIFPITAKPNELKEYDKRQIYVLLCRLKKKIKEVIEIKSINGYGYRLKIRE